MWLPCMPAYATNNKRATAGKGKALEAQRSKILSNKNAKTFISHLLEDSIRPTDKSDIDCETNSDLLVETDLK